MRGATDEPVDAVLEHRAARRTVEAHDTRGYCGLICRRDPDACTQIGWARDYLARRGELDQAVTVTAGEEHVMLHVENASTIPGWVKGGRCDNSGPNCVEVAPIQTGVAMRNSAAPTGPALQFTAAEWDTFLRSAKDGDFDHLAAA